MLIVYCETCGFRIQEDELNSGLAQQVAENKFNCAKCSAAAASANAPRRSTPSATAVIQRHTPDGGRPVSGVTASVRPKSTVIRTASAAAGPAEAPADGPRGVRKPLPVIPIAAGGVVALVLFAVIFALKTGTESTVATAPVPGKSGDSSGAVQPSNSRTPASPTLSAANKKAEAPAETPEERMRRVMEETARGNSPRPESLTPPAPAPAPSSAGTGGLGIFSRTDPADDSIFNERAQRTLKDIQDWYAKNSNDPWTYKERLESFTQSYRSAPASQDAKKLLAEIKLPEGERPPERMNWQKDWAISAGASQTTFFEEFDGRRFVFQTHPIEQGKPCITSRTFTVPTDRPFFEFRLRGHNDGDHRHVVQISGVEVLNENIGGKEWRNFTFDLSPLKEKSVEIKLIHHNTGWACEFAYLQSPHFVEKPASGARVIPWVVKNAAPAPAVTDIGHGTPSQAKAAPADPFSPEADYAAASDDAFNHLAKGNSRGAREALEKLAADSRFVTLKSRLKLDLDCVKMAESFPRAPSKGAQALGDGRPFSFVQTNGKVIAVGKGTKNSVKEASDSLITIEQDFGGGKALTRLGLDQLTPQTRFELARIAFQADPEGDLHTALHALLLVRSGQADVPQRLIRTLLDGAHRKPAQAAMAEHLAQRFESAEKELAAEQAFQKLEQAIAARKMDDARKLLESLEKEHGASAFWSRSKAVIARANKEIEAALSPREKGLMFEYCRPEGNDRFKVVKLRRAETKLKFEWGDNEPAPGVERDFSARARGFLRIEKPGRYGFWVRADDYGALSINGKKVVDSPSNSTAEGEIELPAGDHPITLEFQDTGGGAVFQVRWRLVGSFDLQDIPEGVLFHDPRTK